MSKVSQVGMTKAVLERKMLEVWDCFLVHDESGICALFIIVIIGDCYR